MTDIQKEGEGGGGSFGESGGTAFTSTDAGIFTPTYGGGRKPKKEKRTGIHRLADFLTDNSPERKMVKGDTSITVTNLINWVKKEMQREDELRKSQFHQQTSGDSINPQPPRIDWQESKNNKATTEEDNSVSEFDSKPDKAAATTQKDEERRIRMLDDKADKKDNAAASTGSAAQAAPAGLNIRLSAWESSGSSDELKQGSDKDKKQGEVEELDEETDERLFRKALGDDFYDMLKSLQSSNTNRS